MWKKTAACMGDNCVDYYDETDEARFGGNPVNVAVHLAGLGVRTAYLGVVGNDVFGKAMITEIAGRGVDVSHVQIAEGKTALTHVSLQNGERVFGDYEEGVMETYRLTDEDRNFIGSCDIVVTGIWGHCENELAYFHGRGVLTVFDCADKPDDKEALTAAPHTDYLFLSDDSAGDAELEDKLRRLRSRGAGVVIATRGEKGSMAYDGERFVSCGIVPCELVDTMGAGDSYIAGFAAAVLKERPVDECMRAGAEQSSRTIGYNGAW